MLKVDSPTRFRSTPWSRRSEVVLKMPVDFASYLLASSPPGLGFYGYNDDFRGKGYTVKCHVAGRPLKPIIIKPKMFDEPSLPNSPNSPTSVCSSDEEDECCHGCRPNAHPCHIPHTQSDSALLQRNQCKKRVTFADSKGLALTKVKVLTESSDTPPKLQPQLLASLTQGASAGVSETPPLTLDFAQPASDYVNFRRKLNHQNISLENVILKDYNVMGTIKVKNLSFEKKVFVRCSFDSWKSYTDIAANYVPAGAGLDAGHVMHDTFSFDITVPSTLNLNQVVEFCVCYECQHGQFWDNAEGRNYKVVPTQQIDGNPIPLNEKQYTSDYKPNFDNVDSWSEYSSWSHIDRETPYY